ncbi:MAG: hypothetical protein JXR91_04940 [Deltaproteobacteria bacterium]|nr:hypothetical protein [Deltaproteobacteria bacterium]
MSKILMSMFLITLLSGCSGGSDDDSDTGSSVANMNFDPFDDELPVAGNPDGGCAVPVEAGEEDVSSPDTVIGDGTAASCTSEAVVDAVAKGGIITFNCGDDPVVIEMEATAKVFNNSVSDDDPDVVIDGGGKVTLSGMGKRRILYMNTCDQDQVWTTPHCDSQDHPHLTVQNITFINANSKGETEYEGGGAIYASGGRFKAVNARFFNNVCADTGPDLGGAGIRLFQQFEGKPAYVVNCTFGGAEEFGNQCSNGGGISSIGVSWSIYNSIFSYNKAVGVGANPAQDGTPGGGSGGGIYNDGNTMTLSLCGTKLEYNEVNAHGDAIFFVTNDHSGNIVIEQSVIENNIGGSWYALPGISMHDDTKVDVDDASVLTN